MDNITLKIVFFGSLKSYFGSQLQMNVTKGSNLVLLVKQLADMVPDSIPMLGSCKIAVDSELKSEDFSIVQSHEIAILPPFSGG